MVNVLVLDDSRLIRELARVMQERVTPFPRLRGKLVRFSLHIFFGLRQRPDSLPALHLVPGSGTIMIQRSDLIPCFSWGLICSNMRNDK
jgi:hypothetical protein